MSVEFLMPRNDSNVRWRSALLQGLAVLVGILLAFGVDAAWDSRQDRLIAQAYLASLAAELEANRLTLESSLEDLDITLENTERYLVDVVADPSGPVSQDSIRGMLSVMGPLRVTPLQRSAFEDLTSGGLQTIDDAAIRRLVLGYGEALERDRLRQQFAQDWFARRAQPYDEMEADLVGMGSLFNGGWATRTDLSFDVDPASFVSNRRYGNLLAARAFWVREVQNARLDLVTKMDELLRHMEAR